MVVYFRRLNSKSSLGYRLCCSWPRATKFGKNKFRLVVFLLFLYLLFLDVKDIVVPILRKMAMLSREGVAAVSASAQQMRLTPKQLLEKLSSVSGSLAITKDGLELKKDDIFASTAMEKFRSLMGQKKSVVHCNRDMGEHHVVLQNGPVQFPIEHSVPEDVAELQQQGFRNAEVVAVDIHIKSHIPEGTNVGAVVALVDGCVNDPTQAMVCGGIVDLGHQDSHIFCAPGWTLSYLDKYFFERLQLWIMLYNAKHDLGTSMLTTTTTSFVEHKSPVQAFSRTKREWDSLVRRKGGDKVLCSNTVQSIEAEVRDIPEFAGTIAPMSIGSRSKVLRGANLVDNKPDVVRGSSFRLSVPRISRDKTDQDEGGAESSSALAPVAGGNWSGMAVGGFPTASMDQRAVGLETVASQTVKRAEFTEYVDQLQYSSKVALLDSSNQVNFSFLRGSHIRDWNITHPVTNLVEGFIVFAIDLPGQLYASNSALNSRVLAYVNSGNVSINMVATISCEKTLACVFKCIYDEDNAIPAGTSNILKSHCSAGLVFNPAMTREAKLACTPLVTAISVPWRGPNVRFGRYFLVCLVPPPSNVATGEITFRCSAYIESFERISRWYGSAQGCLDKPEGLVTPLVKFLPVQVPVLNVKIPLSTTSGAQWRISLDPSIGHSVDTNYQPGLSECQLRMAAGWRGVMLIRYTFVCSPFVVGTFVLAALPSGDYRATVLHKDVLMQGRYCEADLQSNSSGYLRIRVDDWRGFSFGGGGNLSISDVTSCPWLAMMLVTNLRTASMTGETRIGAYVEIVGIEELELLGNVPLLNVPGTGAMGSGLRWSMKHQYSKFYTLKNWGVFRTFSFPISPTGLLTHPDSEAAVEQHQYNPFSMFARQYAYWNGSIHYRVTIRTKAGSVLNEVLMATVSGGVETHQSFGLNNAKWHDGGIMHSTSSTQDLVLAFEVERSDMFHWLKRYQWTDLTAEYDTVQVRSTHFNGWIHLRLPASALVEQVEVYARPGSDFEVSVPALQGVVALDNAPAARFFTSGI